MLDELFPRQGPGPSSMSVVFTQRFAVAKVLLTRQAHVPSLRAPSGGQSRFSQVLPAKNGLDRMKIVLNLDTAIILPSTGSAKMLRTGSTDELILRVSPPLALERVQEGAASPSSSS